MNSKIILLNDARIKRRERQAATFSGIDIPATGPTVWISGLGSLSVYRCKGRTRVIEEYLRAAQASRLFFPSTFDDLHCTASLYDSVPLYDIAKPLTNAGVSHAHDSVWSTRHTRAIADLILVQAVFKYKSTCDLVDKVIFGAKSRGPEIMQELSIPMSRLDHGDLRRLRAFLSLANIDV